MHCLEAWQAVSPCADGKLKGMLSTDRVADLEDEARLGRGSGCDVRAGQMLVSGVTTTERYRYSGEGWTCTSIAPVHHGLRCTRL